MVSPLVFGKLLFGNWERKRYIKMVDDKAPLAGVLACGMYSCFLGVLRPTRLDERLDERLDDSFSLFNWHTRYDNHDKLRSKTSIFGFSTPFSPQPSRINNNGKLWINHSLNRLMEGYIHSTKLNFDITPTRLELTPPKFYFPPTPGPPYRAASDCYPY